MQNGNELFYRSTCQSVHLQKDENRPTQLDAENVLVSSCLDTLDAEIKPRGLSIKYVARGRERYHVNKRDFTITTGRYLLVNETSPALEARINTPNTWGMCVDINPALVSDVLQQVITPDQIDTPEDLPHYFLTDDLFVHEYAAGPKLAGILESMMIRISSQSELKEPQELLFDLTSQLIRENLPTIRSYYRLKAARPATRRELYRRLLRGRELLESAWDQRLDMRTVAEECCLSEFRFYRLFKQCFGISPGQYVQQRRIEESIILSRQDLSWTEIALHLNFTDLAAFSNAFKKVKGVSPSAYKASLG